MMSSKFASDFSNDLISFINGGDYPRKQPISFVAVNGISATGLDLSWYPEIYNRLHEVRVFLPRHHVLTSLSSWQHDLKPHLIVDHDWLIRIYRSVNSVFALVDAIGVKQALAADIINEERLLILRTAIDDIAANHPDVSFVSFADSIILKSNWIVSEDGEIPAYTYHPEKIIKVLPELASAYRDVLGMEIYAVVSQGQNEFYGHHLTHTSKSGNHFSLNSLGLPFAQLMDIEAAAKVAAKNGCHSYAQLYLDTSYFQSLKLQHNFHKDKLRKHIYFTATAKGPCEYVCCSFDEILANLR